MEKDDGVNHLETAALMEIETSADAVGSSIQDSNSKTIMAFGFICHHCGELLESDEALMAHYRVEHDMEPPEPEIKPNMGSVLPVGSAKKRYSVESDESTLDDEATTEPDSQKSAKKQFRVVRVPGNNELSLRRSKRFASSVPEADEDPILNVPDDDDFFCAVCKVRFVSQRALNSHCEMLHPEVWALMRMSNVKPKHIVKYLKLKNVGRLPNLPKDVQEAEQMLKTPKKPMSNFDKRRRKVEFAQMVEVQRGSTTVMYPAMAPKRILGSSFGSKSLRMRGSMSHASSKSRKYLCSQCDLFFKTASECRKHLIHRHLGKIDGHRLYIGRGPEEGCF